MTVVATECFEIDFVQNDSQEIIVDAAGSGGVDFSGIIQHVRRLAGK